MKFVLHCLHIKLYIEIYNTALNCTTKCTTCCTIKLNEKLGFLCFGFVKQAKNKSLHPQLSIQVISREIPQT